MVITLTGNNAYALQSELKKRTAEFVAAEGDMALERVDGEDASIDRLSEVLTSLPFLSNKKMVQLRAPGASKQFAEQAADLLTNVPETTEVIVVEPKLDKRSSYYKFLKSKTDFKEFNELDPGGLARWLSAAAKERGGSLSPADSNYLVSRVGANQQLLANELDKLLLYSKQITRDSILVLTEAAPQSSVFELLDAAFAGRRQQALALYAEQRALKVEPQQIIAMLSWQLHILALIKAAGQRSPEAIASEAKVSPYTVKKSLSIARGLTLAEVKRLISDLAIIDGRSKREAFNIDAALQHYLLTLPNN